MSIARWKVDQASVDPAKTHDDHIVNVLSLCSGVGMLDLGIRMAVPGARTVCMVEREAYCVEILAKRMEEGWLDSCPVWTDLVSLDGTAWRGIVDCIVGGYPCQPFSVAGRRRGEEDPRHLWPYIARIVRDVQPAMVFFENVAGHLSLGFEQVAAELQDMGFLVTAGLFTASEVGAPHRRQRLFILAHHHKHGREGQRERGVFDGERSALGHDTDRCGGEAVADAKGFRSAAFGTKHEGQRRETSVAFSGGSRPEPVADASGCRHGGESQDSEWQEVKRTSSEWIGSPVADAEYTGSSFSRRDAQPESTEFESFHENRERPVADAEGVGPAALGTEHEGQRGEACPAVCGCAMENPDSRDAEGAARRGRVPVGHRRDQDGRVADSGFVPRQDETAGCDEGGAAVESSGGHSGKDLLFPPGPSDYEAWSRVDPAAQPAVCRMAHGSAPRVDRLRALGNGVVPLVAAVAFRTLAEQALNAEVSR